MRNLTRSDKDEEAALVRGRLLCVHAQLCVRRVCDGASVPSMTLLSVNYLEVVSIKILKAIEEFVFRSVEIAADFQLASNEFKCTEHIRYLK